MTLNGRNDTLVEIKKVLWSPSEKLIFEHERTFITIYCCDLYETKVME